MKRINSGKWSSSCLKLARADLKVSQQDLATMLGVSRTTISTWEKQTNCEWLKHLCVGLTTCLKQPNLDDLQELSGPQLCALRVANGWQQMDLAHKMNVSRSTVSRWENNRPPKWVAYATISIIFRANTDAYF